MKKTALVLGGGGARGAYEAGVWRALRELGETFDIITGTSVGSLNGAMIAQGDPDTAEALWSQITTEMVLDLGEDADEPFEDLSAREKLMRLGLFAREIVVNRGADTTPLRQLLERHVDEARVRASGVELGLVTVRLEDARPCALYLDEIPEGMLIDYLMASSTCFPAMKKQIIGEGSYIDGGFYDSLPVELALQRGAQRIVAVDLATLGRYRSPALPPDVEIEYIATAWNLGPILQFDPEKARHNMTLGYYDLRKARGLGEGSLYTFEPGESAALMEAAVQANLRWKTVFGAELPRLLPVLRLRILRSLKSRYRSLMVRGAPKSARREIPPALAAVENAGVIFGLDPTVSYSARSFREALHRQIAATQTPDVGALAGLADRSLTLADRGEKLRRESEKLSARSVACLLLREAQTPSLSVRQLAALAAAFPAEAAAAAVAGML